MGNQIFEKLEIPLKSEIPFISSRGEGTFQIEA
jgi:hypothetical protein